MQDRAARCGGGLDSRERVFHPVLTASPDFSRHCDDSIIAEGLKPMTKPLLAVAIAAVSVACLAIQPDGARAGGPCADSCNLADHMATHQMVAMNDMPGMGGMSTASPAPGGSKQPDDCVDRPASDRAYGHDDASSGDACGPAARRSDPGVAAQGDRAVQGLSSRGGSRLQAVPVQRCRKRSTISRTGATRSRTCSRSILRGRPR